jgi:hypothetical protein
VLHVPELIRPTVRANLIFLIFMGWVLKKRF